MLARILVYFAAVAALGCGSETIDLTTQKPAPALDVPAGDRKGDSGTPVSSDGQIDWDLVAQRCGPPAQDEPVVFADDFRWGYNLEDMSKRFEEMYASRKRLKDRAYYDQASGRFILPITETWGGEAELSTRLIQNLRMHIEKALARGYAEFIFFPDMGHSHFFIPQAHWDAEYRDMPAAEYGKLYARLFADPQLKVLYHTAEQLEQLDEDDHLLPNRHMQWRFFTRNPVGDNDFAGRVDLLHEPDSKANTARDYPGHHYFGGGFGFTATADGCFPYVHNGTVMYFDISMSELPYSSNAGSGLP